MKRGLALEGGGAKGAYHIGVVKAFVEKGYDFDGYVGTSIGAVNAAKLAQGEFDKALELWMNISPDQIFMTEEQPLLQLADIKSMSLNAELVSGVRGALSRVIGSKGVSTERMQEFLHKHIDEDKVRVSGKDFGLVTLSLSERKPYELMLDDIPYGKLINYIMASASFPGFSAVTIDGKKYIDGGFYNNCPVNLLDKLGYDEIIAIRVGAPGVVNRKINTMKNVKLISPSESLGRLMQFSPDSSAASIRLGYFDGLRFIEKNSYF
ncbi:MAG: patatin-like phospholipase family protein [Defluviitaleaceae bacterium]|nr:patatin-like phospholipase family protein [Defluviitaleaceae bacterium]